MKATIKYGFALFSFFAALATAGTADSLTARQWLEKMIKAVNELNYQGTFVYLHGNQLETMRIAHAVYDGKIREQLISLNGAPREVMRDQDSVTCVMPESEKISIDKRPLSKEFFSLLPDELSRLEANYRFLGLGRGRVAERETTVVAIVPKDGLRYGYRFFLDLESALPLKADLMNEQGKAVEQTMFTQLEIGIAEIIEREQGVESTLTKKLKLPEAGRGKTLSKQSDDWEFKSLPAGFELSMRNSMPAPDGEQTVEQYVLSDGLASLSVFIEPVGHGESLEGVSRLGAINAWGGQRYGYQLTAVGEVPAATLLGIVEAMRFIRR
jgi:sigma-E factor negative regulatory protein RseB